MKDFEIKRSRLSDERLRFRKNDLFVLIFSGKFIVDGILNTHPVTIPKNSLIILDEKDSFYLVSTSSSDDLGYELYVSRSFLDTLSTASIDLSECFRYKDFRDDCIIHLSDDEALLIERLMSYLFEMKNDGRSYYGASYISRLIVSYVVLLTNRFFRADVGLADEDISLPSNSRFSQIASYIRENYWEDITLDGLSLMFHISRNDLCALFRKMSGRTPIQYLIEYRIEKAKEFLRNSVSVEDVCTKVGFNNYPHFSRTFHKRVGMSPKQYQRE